MRYLTGGESHGPSLTAIVEGLPAGLSIDPEGINRDLARRQAGYGRGTRMRLEADQVAIRGGIYRGITTGAPLVLEIPNRDHHLDREEQLSPINFPRPGHADLAGVLKYGGNDIRPVAERASARETAIRTAVGSVARQLLAPFGFRFLGFVTGIGVVTARISPATLAGELEETVERSPVRCPDRLAEREMVAAIDAARDAGDTLGGTFQVVATGVLPGLGSHVHWDRKLDGRLAQGILAIQAVKGVEIGLGFEAARRPGSAVHDEIEYDGERFVRFSNNAGGIEGGISNGEPIWLSGAIKPIPTLRVPLRSVDLRTKEPATAHYQRSDTCVVPAASVIAEAVTAWVLAEAFREKFGGDSMEEVSDQVAAYRRLLVTR